MRNCTQQSCKSGFLLFKKIAFILFVFIQANPLSAHSLEISNISVEQEAASKASIQFSLNWQDGWHYNSISPGNYDAVWIFAKYLATDGSWRHIKVNGFIPHSAANIQLPSDNNGVFISPYISDVIDIFEGDVSLQDIKLRWNYAQAEIQPMIPYQVRIYGIEMVYIPQASFYAGADSLEAGDAAFFDFDSLGTEGFATTDYTYIMNPFPKTLIMKDKATASGGFPQVNTSLQYQPSSNKFPNGYKGFYCMKYEISQQQYADFLNTLIPMGTDELRHCDPAAELGHDCSRIKRYTLIFDTDMQKYVTEYPNLPIEYLGWDDGAAYADWAALRPMTELEYEKICRGPANEYEPLGLNYDYAYGEGEPKDNVYEITWVNNNGESYDSIINLESNENNIIYRKTWAHVEICEDEDGEELIGFFQNGTFAQQLTQSGDSLTRKNTGASYYGVMEMSGNLNERCIGIKERWMSTKPDADTTTNEYDWPEENTPSCGATGVTFITTDINGLTKYYKDCPSKYKGSNGNGELGEDGYANNTDWPKEKNGNGAGSMNRGGRWNQQIQRCYVADRMALSPASGRTHESTMRFVRTF